MNMLKQLTAMQAKMSKIQSELEVAVFEGSAGNGLVTLSVNGKGELLKLDIAEATLSEGAELVSDLIKAAFKDATSKKEAKSKELLGSLAPGLAGTGLKIPGLG